MARKIILFTVIVLTVALSGCRTYYQRQREFNEHFRAGRIEQAAQVLSSDRKGTQRRTRLLHFMNMGTVYHLMGQYSQSNTYFEKAYLLGEDFINNPADAALALMTNPKMTEYRGEDFELLMIHYYKAMNFIQLGDFDAALVECRRLNLKLNVLSDKYPSDNRYKRDAFIQNLMGIIYEASGDNNNAFIAYRNAYTIYTEDYKRMFGVDVPAQLKADLLRSAYNTGFYDQVEYFQNKFGMQHTPAGANNQGQLVFFLNNGLGPVKDEWSINFTLVRGSGGRIDFVNEELGLSFPFHAGQSASSSGELGDLRIVRVAFPRYLERQPFFTGAQLAIAGSSYRLEKAQDVNAIAFKSLEDRMLREMGSALLRLALKQASEQLVRSQNENAGAILGLINTATEQADTRNWQTLPHSIHYTRISLPEGNHNLTLELKLPNNHTGRTVNFQTTIRPGRTTFINYHSIDSRPPGRNR